MEKMVDKNIKKLDTIENLKTVKDEGTTMTDLLR
jgi:hypothetical protein